MDNRALLTGIGLGATLAFVLDPDGGARRRALVRDKIVRGSKTTARALDATIKDAANRTRGIAAATRSRWSGTPGSDARLVERVRARLGRVASHPRAIDVDAVEGEVTLAGPILSCEADGVVAMARRVPGVRVVVDELDRHETADGIPSLQGEGRLGEPRLDLFQSNWAPGTRALVGMGAVAAAASAVAVYARR